MRFILNCAFALGLLWLLPSAAKCDLVFSVAQRTPGPITLGSDAIFDLFVRSTTENQPFVIVGVELQLGNTTGAGGLISLTNATSELGGAGWEDVGDTALLPPGVYVAYFGDRNATIESFGLSNTRIGSFILSTIGATANSYDLNFVRTTAVDSFDPGGGEIPSSGVSATYTIAVPEPTSMALVCVAGVGALWGYRRRAKVC